MKGIKLSELDGIHKTIVIITLLCSLLGFSLILIPNSIYVELFKLPVRTVNFFYFVGIFISINLLIMIGTAVLNDRNKRK